MASDRLVVLTRVLPRCLCADIGYDRGDVYLPERLDASVLKHDNASTEFNNQRYLQTKPFVPIGHIPEVKFTASYLDGNYAMGNEHGVSLGASLLLAVRLASPFLALLVPLAALQLMMGESTCAAHLVAYPPPLGESPLMPSQHANVAHAFES